MNIKAAYIEISNTARDLVEKNGLDYNAAIREAGELYKKKTAQKVPVFEQFIGKCEKCNKTSELTLPMGMLPSDLKPKYCGYCGNFVKYKNNNR